MNDWHNGRRPILTPPRVQEEPSRASVLIGGIVGIALTAMFVAFLVWCALSIADRSDLLSIKELFAIGFGYVTIRSIDLLMVKSINDK